MNWAAISCYAFMARFAWSASLQSSAIIFNILIMAGMTMSRVNKGVQNDSKRCGAKAKV